MKIDYKVPTKPERRMCLIVIDMQECFFEEDDSKEKNRKAIDNIAKAIRSFREHDRDVFIIRYLGDTHSEKEDKTIIKEIGDISGLQIVDKYHMSAFQNTNLADLMTNKGYDSVLICGAYADHCVMATYWSAYEHDMSPFILSDADQSAVVTVRATLEKFKAKVKEDIARMHSYYHGEFPAIPIIQCSICDYRGMCTAETEGGDGDAGSE